LKKENPVLETQTDSQLMICKNFPKQHLLLRKQAVSSTLRVLMEATTKDNNNKKMKMILKLQ
jgi:hypothetical protein